MDFTHALLAQEENRLYEHYYQSIPIEIRNQLRAREYFPRSFDELVQAAAEATREH